MITVAPGRGPDGGGRAPLRVAVLVKQVPRFETFELGPDGRLRRDGVEAEMNPYCRRAVTAGVRIAADTGGTCTVVTLGPPAAEDCLREAVAGGAAGAVLVSDPAFAGSDTLATARAMAAALARLGPFDLVLTGRNSVDADTGQVPAALAELLDLPLAPAVRSLELDGRRLRVRCETDDGTAALEMDLPAVVSCAERLCEPCKRPPEERARVAAARIARLDAATLGGGPWGQEGSPTRVGEVRHISHARQRLRLDGPVAGQVRRAAELLAASGALHDLARPADSGSGAVPEQRAGAVLPGSGPLLAVIGEPGRDRVSRELLGRASVLAARLGATVAGLLPAGLGPEAAAAWGADGVVPVPDEAEEEVAAAAAAWCAGHVPWAVLLPGTMWGREVAARVAARLGAGLVGDAVDLEVDGHGRLVAWKPAFGGSLIAAVSASSPVQMATVRPGVLPLLSPRAGAVARLEPALAVARSGRVRRLERVREGGADPLARARAIVTVGTGVPPEAYPEVQPLLDVLGAEMAGTRKVTDAGWLPRWRQVGITGHSLAPRLYVALGVSGKFNHMAGTRSAGTVMAVNSDPAAPVFDAADVGITGDWREVVPLLVDAIAMRLRDEAVHRSCGAGAADIIRPGR